MATCASRQFEPTGRDGPLHAKPTDWALIMNYMPMANALSRKLLPNWPDQYDEGEQKKVVVHGGEAANTI